MRHLIRLTDWTSADVDDVFALAHRFRADDGPRFDGAVAMFFPPSSIRTRVSFERGAARMGLQPIVFPPESLDKPEALADVAGYLAQFVDAVVVRHPDISALEHLRMSSSPTRRGGMPRLWPAIGSPPRSWRRRRRACGSHRARRSCADGRSRRMRLPGGRSSGTSSSAPWFRCSRRFSRTAWRSTLPVRRVVGLRGW